MARVETGGRYGFVRLVAGLIVAAGPVAGATGADRSQPGGIARSDEPIDGVSGRPSIALVTTDSAARLANPLWGVTLRSLAETRERPIFAPSRRVPERPAVALPAVSHEPEPLAKAPEPAQPPFVLLGTVISPAESIGVLLDQATNSPIRLKTGHGHLGWILRSVSRREALFERNQTSVTLSLPSLSEQRTSELASNGAGIQTMAPWLRQALDAEHASKAK